MAYFRASVRSAKEGFRAGSPAGNCSCRARERFDCLLAAGTEFIDEVGTLGASFFVGMTIMRNRRMAAWGRTGTWEAADGGFGAARDGGLDTCPAAVAGKLFKGSFQTSSAGSAMAEHRAGM